MRGALPQSAYSQRVAGSGGEQLRVVAAVRSSVGSNGGDSRESGSQNRISRKAQNVIFVQKILDIGY